MFDKKLDVSSAIRAALKYLEEGNDNKVIEEVERAFSFDSESPEAIHVLGLFAAKMNEPLRARDLFQKATELSPDKFEHAEALAIINAKLGLLNDSLFYGKLAAALKPYEFVKGLIPAWFGTFEESFMNIQEKPHFKLGKYNYDRGNFYHAISFLQKAVEVDPKDATAWRMLIRSLRICDRSYESLLMLKALDNVGLNDPADLSEVGLVFGDIGLFEESLSCHREVLNFEINNHEFFANYIVSLQKAGLNIDMEHAELDWFTLFGEPIFSYDYQKLLNASRSKLHIGLVSGRFKSKNGLDHLWPLLLNHGQKQMAIHCYSYNHFDDIISRKIAGAVDSWVDLSNIDDRTAATIIYNDNIDILINLDSNLETSHPKVFAYNPAPIMLKYLGSPNVTHKTGYAGVFGGPSCYSDNEVKGIVVDFPLAALSPEIKGASVREASMINNRHPMIGLAAKGSELTPAFFEAIKNITAAVEHSTIVLNTRHLGGGGTLDGIEKQLDEYGLQGKVKFTILDNDKYLSITDFVDQCDVLVVLDHMSSADICWEFLHSSKPVFAVQSNLIHLKEINEIFNLLDIKDWCFDDLSALITELKLVLEAEGDGYSKCTKRLCQNIQAQIGKELLNEKGRELLKSFAVFRKEFLSSCAETQMVGGK